MSATITVNGTSRQEQCVVIQLNPHQTRALDILRDLVGRQQGGTIHKEGGISIAHSGAPGAILARMLVSKESTGFSSVADFVDPQATRSSKWNGSGYRIGKIGNEELTPIVVARNIGSDPTVVSGRLSYTNDPGEVIFINVPAVRVNANDTKMIDVERAVRQRDVPANITDTGFEFEYSTPNGTVIMTALSVSRSENQVFRVPLFDPQRMASSAGGYPWKAEGDYTTVLYIKNETDQPQQYTAALIYEGGNYATGVKDIKPHQLITIDFRALRDNQTPDANKQTIPLNIEHGEIAWSSHGETNKALSGRSHQSSIVEGVSSTYDCRNCCPDNDIYTGASIPGFIYVVPDDIYPFQAEMTTENCFGTVLSTFPDSVYGWGSNSPSVATIESDGTATAISEGEAFFNVDNLSSYRWIIPPGSTECERSREFTSASGEMEVVSGDVTFKTVTSSNNSTTANFTRTFDNNFSADLDLGGGTVNVCSGTPQGFDITINFDLPPNASSVFHPDQRTSVSETDEQQFQHLGFRFEDVVFTPRGRGKMIIRMRRVAEERTDKTIRVKISGGLQQGGSYSGQAKIKFVCP